jgi:hypothetical protein
VRKEFCLNKYTVCTSVHNRHIHIHFTLGFPTTQVSSNLNSYPSNCFCYQPYWMSLYMQSYLFSTLTFLVQAIYTGWLCSWWQFNTIQFTDNATYYGCKGNVVETPYVNNPTYLHFSILYNATYTNILYTGKVEKGKNYVCWMLEGRKKKIEKNNRLFIQIYHGINRRKGRGKWNYIGNNKGEIQYCSS